MNIEALPQVALQDLMAGIDSIGDALLPEPTLDEKLQEQEQRSKDYPPVPESMKSIFPTEANALPPAFHRLKAQLAAQTTSKTSEKITKAPSSALTSTSQVDPMSDTAQGTSNIQSNSVSSVDSVQTLEALKDLHTSCQQCPLGETRLRMVFGEGFSQARLMFIGEGPGADEDAQGKPFVGRSGKLLTKMISALGITRPDVYIANIVKCRPPENRNPKAEEISSCIPILQRQMEIINPDLIVTLGNVPTHALIPETPGITKARGNLQNYRQWKVLPTFHPSYLLRNRNAMPLAWEDFNTIAKILFSPS